MRAEPLELATVEEAEAAIKRLRKALADVGVTKGEPAPEGDATPPAPEATAEAP